MPAVAAVGVPYAVVAVELVQYVYVKLAVLPEVTAAEVRSTVDGKHTAVGLVIVTVGVGVSVTT